MQTKNIKTRLEREVLVQEFLSSGKPKLVWCKEKGIPYSTFAGWLNSYNHDRDPVKFISIKDNINTTKIENKEHKPRKEEYANLLIEIGVCKIHITQSTSITLLTNVMKAVKSLDV